MSNLPQSYRAADVSYRTHETGRASNQRPGGQRRRRWLRSTLFLAGWATTLTGLAGVCLHLLDTQRRTAVLLASGAPYLMCAAIIALLLFAAVRSWLSAAVALLVLLAGVWTQAPMYIPNGSTMSGHEMTVMQTNVFFGRADPNAVVAQVRARNVDVLTVSELTPEAVAALRRAGLQALLPHQYLEPGPNATGTGIWARYPLRDTTKYDGFTLNQVSATMSHPLIGDVEVYAFHPVPPFISAATWRSELRRIGEILTQSRSPAVVGADFNATRDHAAFRNLLRGKFAEAANQAGSGHIVTYPTHRRYPPLIGIDYILVAGGTAEDVDTTAIAGADHRAVAARLRIATGAGQ